MRNLFSHREKYTLGIHQKSTLRLHWTHGFDEWDRALIGIKILSSHIPQQRVAYSMGKRGLRVPRSELRQPCLPGGSEY